MDEHAKDLDKKAVELDPARQGLLNLKLTDFLATQQALENATKKIVELESMIKVMDLEATTLRAHLAEAQARAATCEEAKTQALAQLAAYQAIFKTVAGVFNEFVPPAPAVITRTEPKKNSTPSVLPDYSAGPSGPAFPPKY